MHTTYLASAWSSGRYLPSGGDSASRRAVRSTRHPMRMPCVLLRPRLISMGRVTLVLSHVVAVLGVGRVWRIGGTGGGYGGIYRYFGVRFHMWRRVMMVILLSIVQGHGRTCCLSHTCSTRVAIMLLLMCVLLSRQVLWIQIGRTRRGRSDAEI